MNISIMEFSEQVYRDFIQKEEASSFWSMYNSNLGYALKYHKKLQKDIDLDGRILLSRKLLTLLNSIRTKGIHLKQVKIDGIIVQHGKYI